jgi:hypothetical protein
MTNFEDTAADALAKGSVKGLSSLSAGRRDQDIELFADERMSAVKSLKTFKDESVKVEETVLKLKALVDEAKKSGDIVLLKTCRKLLQAINAS